MSSIFGPPIVGPIGTRVTVVPAGTEITDERTGEKEIVSENGGVMARDGSTLFCTQATFELLKAHFDANQK